MHTTSTTFAYTPEIDIITPVGEIYRQVRQVERAARISHRAKPSTTFDEAVQFLHKLIGWRHLSPFYHTQLAVQFSNVSRGFTHELVRHAHTAFMQQSTRYVEPDDDWRLIGGPTLPEDIRAEAERVIKRLYRQALERGARKEDARQILPIGLPTEIIATTNWVQWAHIFRLRRSKAAAPEMRAAMDSLWETMPDILQDLIGALRQAVGDLG